MPPAGGASDSIISLGSINSWSFTSHNRVRSSQQFIPYKTLKHGLGFGLNCRESAAEDRHHGRPATILDAQNSSREERARNRARSVYESV